MNNRLAKFLISGAVIFVGWFLLYYIILPEPQVLDAPLILFQSHISHWLLQVVGYNATIYDVMGRFTCTISLEGRSAVSVGGECGGLELLVLFAGFIIAYGGNRKALLWFIPVGLAIIILLNILRISSLAAIALHYPQYLDFNHKYTFVIIVYAAIFAMWWIWINKFAYQHEAKR